MTLFSLVFSLILILDPLGNIPIFAAILSKYSHKEQQKIICREMIISLGLLIAFQFLGALLLSWIHITIPSIKVAGGIVLFVIALGMIFPTFNTIGVTADGTGKPFIVPLSVPLVAGPSILAAIMAYSPQIKHPLKMLTAIIMAWAITFLILIFTPWFKKVMKEDALTACTRLMGLVLTFIATEMFLDGLKCFFH